jgi:antitoxin (DNA-binding transcriptional repressor) of toxin-antitoxin stability system
MEINLKEAKSKMGSLLDRSQKGEDVVIMRRTPGGVRLRRC